MDTAVPVEVGTPEYWSPFFYCVGLVAVALGKCGLSETLSATAI